ncbi:MAG: hypothetical protein ABS79_05855 [Planctomycetes bacterium SCN 63-9]|nr:MAG: hypothetical protein ABS79_05855 [Planctomycetes bacterium SCN 63-9]
MRSRFSILLAGSGLLLVAGFATTATAAEGFVTLFNGKDTAGWHGQRTEDPRKFNALSPAEKAEHLAKDAEDAKLHWKVDDGALVNDGHGVYMTSDKDYGDIELYVSWKLIPKGDSGLYLKSTPQVQIWDYTDTSKANLGSGKGSGGLWNNAAGAPGKDPLVLADKPIGEWNEFRIFQIGERTTVYLNGKLVVDNARLENYWNKALPLVAKGPIQLQTHGNEVRWKDIRVREIPAEEANAFLAKRGAEGFQPVFNGKDLTGWAGPVKNYEVKDGAIVCKPGHGGAIYHDKELTDFAARVEFRLPAGGNNGLAIRYPGTGDPAYAGMTELQILDNDAAQYAKLDERQYHGSAYGMAAAARGYLRPTGEWNFQEVTVKGSTIKVELNGSLILNVDISKVDVDKIMAKTPHPGKDRTSGFFGLAGHNDPVAFRMIAIKPL